MKMITKHLFGSVFHVFIFHYSASENTVPVSREAFWKHHGRGGDDDKHNPKKDHSDLKIPQKHWQEVCRGLFVCASGTMYFYELALKNNQID